MDCESIIKQILLEATENGQTISEDELLKRLDETPGFWEMAAKEEKEKKKKKSGKSLGLRK